MTDEQMPAFTQLDQEVISKLIPIIETSDSFQKAISKAFEEAEKELENNWKEGKPFGSAEAPISTIHEGLADQDREHVNLCRAFILKAGHRLPNLEKHRNSVQRLVSFKESGAINIATTIDANVFIRYALKKLNIEKRSTLAEHWNVVPMNTWHYPEADSDADWYTIAFHSASSRDIVDEYRSPKS